MANPIFIPAPFAVNGIKNTIEKIRQSGQAPQDATWDTGWEAITFTPIEAGGKPPKGQDFNGIFYALSQNAVHVQNCNKYKFSQDVIDNYGGYAKDAIVQSDDGSREFISLVDSNTVNPNGGLAGVWSIYAGSGSVPAATSTTAGVTRVINSLNSTEIAVALSAAQGKLLNDSKLNNNQAIGIGQTWINVTSQRSLNSTYTNNTTRPIMVCVVNMYGDSADPLTVYIDGSILMTVDKGFGNITSDTTFLVPPNATYRVIKPVFPNIQSWMELR